MKTTRSTMRSVCPQTENRRYTSTEPALLPIILVGHVGPCRTDTDGFGCYPNRAADIVRSSKEPRWPLPARASSWPWRMTYLVSVPCAPPGLRADVAVATFKEELKRVCDRNHILVEV